MLIKSKVKIAVILCLALYSTSAMANVPRPSPTPKPSKKSKQINTNLRIQIDNAATEARLLIPRSQFNQLRAEFESGQSDSDNFAGIFPDSSRIILAGFCLSLGLFFGGLWFMKKSPLARAGSAALIITAIVATAYSNVGPPLEKTISSRLFSPAVLAYNYAQGGIILEVSDQVQEPTLIVPLSK
ncbi:MAG TPA: hypothetical protein VNK26_02005 [Pyrinomonadaceae bacterium]|nr:hypothetical protein [Pyrinomonadaceae bacterium]